MSVKIKVTDVLKDIKFGTPQDDAVYLYFLLGKVSVGHKLIADIKADKKYICTLYGENDIINYKGESITGADQYLSYAKKGKAGMDMLNFNRKAYLYIEDMPGLVFDSMADIQVYFEHKQQVAENKQQVAMID